MPKARPQPNGAEAPAQTERDGFIESVLSAIATAEDPQAVRDRLMADMLYQLTSASNGVSAMMAQIAGGGMGGILGMFGRGKKQQVEEAAVDA